MAMSDPHAPPDKTIIDEEGGETVRIYNPRGTARSNGPKPNGHDCGVSSLASTHKLFREWLSDGYDTETLDAVLAAAAAHALGGDPLWLLVISGPGAAKTETVQALAGASAHVTSTIASEGALLSASPKKGRVKGATGGLLRKIGDDGMLVIKDFTSILSMDRNIRASVLAALREIYDGRWERNVGTDGGQTLTWEGHITVIAAVTTAWDSAHAVISSMGDRFVIIRADSTSHREQSGRQAIRNTGKEVRMRAELAAAVGTLLAAAKPNGAALEEADEEKLLALADVVTFARTAVETDYKGDVLDAHAPEMPTRFAKQLSQVVRGAEAIGLDHEAAMHLAIRCARDLMPPFRLRLLCDIAEYPEATTLEIRSRINKPLATVKRQLEGLQVLGLLTARKEDKVWHWSLGRLLNGNGLHYLRQFRIKNRKSE